MSAIIKIQNISKIYKIGSVQPYYSLRDTLAASFSRKHNVNKKDFWALKDISFDVVQGDRVGIIGRNGAGKSTLLKILSQITPPTTGRITMRGRVASLLEVGTGFHPELTGRENIYLNGAILGMRRKEIDNKFDEIVAFSEIEKFLDTPIKRYSSGMYVRLAFAVAAHLEPEILLIDEVLAVGDIAFQKKCLGKMDEVSKKEGRTVLFVSHNMAAIQALCNKCILLENGRTALLGETSKVVNYYINHEMQTRNFDFTKRRDRKGTQELIITSVEFRDSKTNKPARLASGKDAKIYLGFQNKARIGRATVSIGFNSIYGQRLLTLWSKFSGNILSNLPPKGFFICRVPKFPLKSNPYTIDVYAESGGSILDVIYNAAQIDVGEGDFYGTGQYPTESQGDIMTNHEWYVTHE